MKMKVITNINEGPTRCSRRPATAWLVAAWLLAGSQIARAQEPPPPPPPPPSGGPALTLPPDSESVRPREGVGTGRRIPIGAYGEAHLVHSGDETEATLRRFVIFLGYQFADWA